MKKLAALLSSLTIFSLAHASLTPEQQTLEISKLLKAVPDDEWEKIAGKQFSESYGITSGDTLYDVSKRLFGDGKYWPKVWALNNESITNPHLIHPGNSIRFMPGTGTSLPSVTIAQNDVEAAGTEEVVKDISNSPLGAGRSTEWKALPPQTWETVKVTVPPQVDPLGFDKRSKIVRRKPDGFELAAVAASGEMPALGKIVGAEQPGFYLGLKDVVFIDTEGGTLDIDKEYSITTQPNPLQSARDQDTRLSYPNVGRIKVIGKKDQQFIGEILEGKDAIQRGEILIPLIPKFPEPVYIPAPQMLQGSLLVDTTIMSANNVVQGREVFVDLGSVEGIQPGMVFRVYLHKDPATGKEISGSDYIVASDLTVIQVSPKVSSLLVIGGELPVSENAQLVLLTDVSDIGKKKYGKLEQTVGAKPSPEPSAAPAPEPTVAPSSLTLPASPEPAPTTEPSPTTPIETPSGTPTPATTPEATATPSNGDIAPPPPTAPEIPSVTPTATPGAPAATPTTPPAPAAPPADDLDKLNKGGSLSPEQEKELQKLENAVPPAPPAPPPSSGFIPPPTTPTGDNVPPPPELN